MNAIKRCNPEQHQALMDEAAAKLHDALMTYRDGLIMQLKAGYEDSSYRYIDNVEEADLLDLQDTSSLESDTVETLSEWLSEWIDEYLDIEQGASNV